MAPQLTYNKIQTSSHVSRPCVIWPLPISFLCPLPQWSPGLFSNVQCWFIAQGLCSSCTCAQNALFPDLELTGSSWMSRLISFGTSPQKTSWTAQTKVRSSPSHFLSLLHFFSFLCLPNTHHQITTTIGVEPLSYLPPCLQYLKYYLAHNNH